MAVPLSKKQEVLRLLQVSASSRTNRGAIRPYGRRNGVGVRKGFAVGTCSRFVYSG